ncbi:MAG: glycoside hydrolase family 2 protein [bacterium]
MSLLRKTMFYMGFFFQLAMIISFADGATRSSGFREEVTLAAGWRFQLDATDLGEKERWHGEDFDRSAWAKVDVPKAWDLYNQALWGYEGIGWYTLTIEGKLARPGMIQTLRFGRINYHTRVWLNGKCLGENTGGYLPFEFEVTNQLKPDSPNILVLRVDNRPRLEWLPAAKQIEWIQYGGILEPVVLVTKENVHISELAINAVPNGKGASITCAVTICNHGTSEQDVELRMGVSGNEDSWRSVPLLAGAGETLRREIQITMDRSKAWSPESPALFTLEAIIESHGQALDRVASRFGVRKIEARGRDILLNGNRLHLRGVNRYDEYGVYGPNPPRALVIQDLRAMKKAGVNLVRMHYPQSPDLLSLYDEMGFLVIEELPINWWGNSFSGKDGEVQSEDLLTQALPMLERMIHRDRNHPSTIIWSMANESRTDTEPGIRVMRRLIQRTKELDPARLVTYVTNSSDLKTQKAYEEADLAAINVYQGQFGGEIASHIGELEERVHQASVEYIQRQLASFPGKPMIVTEYGTRGVPGVHGDAPYTEEFQAAFIQAAWQAIQDCHEVSGGVLWCWADYYHRREFIQYAVFGPYGVVTVDRHPKAALRTLAAMYGGT